MLIVQKPDCSLWAFLCKYSEVYAIIAQAAPLGNGSKRGRCTKLMQQQPINVPSPKAGILSTCSPFKTN